MTESDQEIQRVLQLIEEERYDFAELAKSHSVITTLEKINQQIRWAEITHTIHKLLGQPWAWEQYSDLPESYANS